MGSFSKRLAAHADPQPADVNQDSPSPLPELPEGYRWRALRREEHILLQALDGNGLCVMYSRLSTAEEMRDMSNNIARKMWARAEQSQLLDDLLKGAGF